MLSPATRLSPILAAVWASRPGGVLDALLLRALPAALYTAALYPLVRLTPGASRVASFVLILGTFAACAGALALVVAAAARNSGQVTLLMNLLLLLWVLVGGYLVNPSSMPLALRWLRYTSPMSYAFEALFANQVKGTRFVFDVDGYARVDDVAGETFMEALGLSPQYALRDVGVLAAFYFAFVAAALALTWATASAARRRDRMLPTEAAPAVKLAVMRLPVQAGEEAATATRERSVRAARSSGQTGTAAGSRASAPGMALRTPGSGGGGGAKGRSCVMGRPASLSRKGRSKSATSSVHCPWRPARPSTPRADTSELNSTWRGPERNWAEAASRWGWLLRLGEAGEGGED
ncbi:ABC transporter G family member 7 [Tetrabaena socialis]|uniref:ABC transporter G family member 7 n=1 Tax=Tetrabaena socialis TaxID=47790 RepID=A0A2J8A727_9CHLO|nr:ABC transporter G family member 7 [Tetrabaena socialis]|eukprot:PNH08329.1 ABC transporter G family member 7 [Tetrabaena socialis]